MEELLKQIKQSPEYSAISQKFTDDQLKEMLAQYQNQPKEGELDEEGGAVITPNPGIVIKTFDTTSKEKVFLNICSHDIIDMPEQQDIPDQEHLGLRVPLSLGPPRQDFDKHNQICTVYDIVVNPQILEKTQEDSTTRLMLVELCVNHIARKYSQNLSMSNQ